MTHFKFVRNRAHDAAHRKAVEVIIDKNQDAKNNSRNLRTDFRFYMQLRPVSKSGCRARLVHQGYHRPKHHQEKENAHIPRIGHLFHHSIFENSIQELREAPLANKKAANHDPDKKG